MNFRGTVIEESLEDPRILKNVTIIQTTVKPATTREKTPWIKQWTLHTVEVPEQEAGSLAEALSVKLDGTHPWYADFKDDKNHYIVFRNKVFHVNRTKPEDYQKATAYGLTLGIPDYQLDFSEHILTPISPR